MSSNMANKGRWQTCLLYLHIAVSFTCSRKIWVSEADVKVTWSEAKIHCHAMGGYLLQGNPRTKNISQELGQDEYWIGARVITQPWTWSISNERLYEYLGYSPNSQVRGRQYRLYNNRVFTCFYHCSTTYIAIQDNLCTCMTQRFGNVLNTTDALTKCPGSDTDLCGNATGYSIYHDKLSTIAKFRSVRNNSYSYIWTYLRQTGGRLEIVSSNNSHEKMHFLCNSPSNPKYSIFKVMRSRPEASRFCQGYRLLQVESGMNLRRPIDDTYWIGLHRSYEWRWINGSQVNPIPTPEVHKECLGVRGYDTLTFSSFNCSDSKRFICEIPLFPTPAGKGLTPGAGADAPGTVAVGPWDWRVWVGIGVGTGVVSIGLIVVIFTVANRLRNVTYTPDAAERKTSKRNVKPTHLTIDNSIMEPEYSDVRDALAGREATPEPSIQDNPYSEPCVDAGTLTKHTYCNNEYENYVILTDSGNVSEGGNADRNDALYARPTKMNLKDNSDESNLQTTNEGANGTYYSNVSSVDGGAFATKGHRPLRKCESDTNVPPSLYSVPHRKRKTDDEDAIFKDGGTDAYDTPRSGHSKSSLNSSCDSWTRDGRLQHGYDIPKSASFTARSRTRKEHVAKTNSSKGFVKKTIGSKFEQGSYDVPRNNSSNSLRSNHSNDNQYQVPQNDNLYSCPRK